MSKNKSNKLPPFLESYEKRRADGGITTHFRYVFPDGKRRSLGQNKNQAIRAARVLNDRTAEIRQQRKIDALLAKENDPLLASNPTFSKVADAWVETKADKLAKNSLKNRLRQINKLKQWFGDFPIQSITTYDISRRLDLLSAHSYKAHRNAAAQIWKYAQQRGYTNINPVLPTEPPSIPPRERKRHTWAGYQATLAMASEWLFHTMQIALYSLQRQDDLVKLKWDKVDLENNTIDVKQAKTGVWLKIIMGQELKESLLWFQAQNLNCPYVIARIPRCRTKALLEAVKEGRQHLYQVLGNTVSHAFTTARNKSGYYDHLPANRRPAFRDLRALGIFALAKAGYPDTYIQALAGHATLEMTHYYMEGHEQVRPVTVEAGLSVQRVDWDAIDWDESISSTLGN